MSVAKRIHCVLALQGTVPSPLSGLSHYFFQHLHEVESIITPILQTRKLRFSEVKVYASEDPVQKVANRDLNQDFWDLRLFVTLHWGRGWRSSSSIRANPLLLGRTPLCYPLIHRPTYILFLSPLHCIITSTNYSPEGLTS